MTPFQLDASAKAPCTSTIVGCSAAALATEPMRQALNASAIAVFFMSSDLLESREFEEHHTRVGSARRLHVGMSLARGQLSQKAVRRAQIFRVEAFGEGLSHRS